MTVQPRRARKADANQAIIVALLRELPGVAVLVLNAEVDLIVGYRGRNYLLEVKRDHKAKLKPSQEKLRTTWPGQYSIVSTIDDALAVIGRRTDNGNEAGAERRREESRSSSRVKDERKEESR
jgi:hypothetical protein